MKSQMSQTKIKINDIDEFCKLFRVNIPVKEDFEYYIDTLRKSQEFEKTLSEETLSKFSDFEQWLFKKELNIYKYKMHCLDVIKNYIIQTDAYKSLIEASLSKDKIESRDWTNNVDDHQTLVSLDFRSANYGILKALDLKDELKENWTALCKHLDVHEVLGSSKSFRQLVFGNTSPKRLQTFQQQKIMQLLEYLKTVWKVKDENFVFISHDELIFKVKDANSVHFLIHHALESAEKLVDMSIRCTVFSTEKIKKNVFIKTLHGINPSFNNHGQYYFTDEYKTLHGVPGNKFYMYFKTHILKESYDDRDLIYFNDGELCRWVIQNESKKVVLPHYEQFDYTVSMDEAKTSYSYIWNEMTTLLPHMSSEEKRRVIEIIANTCQHCHQAPVGCYCWNEE